MRRESCHVRWREPPFLTIVRTPPPCTSLVRFRIDRCALGKCQLGLTDVTGEGMFCQVNDQRRLRHRCLLSSDDRWGSDLLMVLNE